MVARANNVCEVLMIRDGPLEFSSDLFECSELDDFDSKLIYNLSRLMFSLFLLLSIM